MQVTVISCEIFNDAFIGADCVALGLEPVRLTVAAIICRVG
jgi:hypothetical protein